MQGAGENNTRQVSVRMPVEDWAKTAAAVGYSPLSAEEKDRINTRIFDAAA